jgi:hypothetical protein
LPSEIKKPVARLLVLLGSTSHLPLYYYTYTGHRNPLTRNPWQDFYYKDWVCIRKKYTSSVKYSTTADTQIFTNKGQILKIAVSGVSFAVSAAFLGLPAKLGCICPRICAYFGVSASLTQMRGW